MAHGGGGGCSAENGRYSRAKCHRPTITIAEKNMAMVPAAHKSFPEETENS